MRNLVQLITYIDRLSPGGLKQLQALLTSPLAGVFGGVHLLPFFHPIDGSDAGFDPIDHTLVDPRLGDWTDVRALSQHVEIMADLICRSHGARRQASGLKIGDWVILPGCKPRYVKMQQVHPRFYGSGFRIRRSQIRKQLPELNELEAQLEQAFPNQQWRYPRDTETRKRLIEYAKTHPIALHPVALQCLHVTFELADTWIGQEGSIAEENAQAA